MNNLELFSQIAGQTSFLFVWRETESKDIYYEIVHDLDKSKVLISITKESLSDFIVVLRAFNRDENNKEDEEQRKFKHDLINRLIIAVNRFDVE